MRQPIPADSRILIVDDEPDHIRLLEAILESVGVPSCLTTTDSRMALQMYAAFQPDLVFLDLQMPHVDGIEVLRQLRASTSEDQYLPVLVLTADKSSDARKRAYAAGASDFLLKPFDPGEVLLRASKVLDIRSMYTRIQRHNHDLADRVVVYTRQLAEVQIELRQAQKASLT